MPSNRKLISSNKVASIPHAIRDIAAFNQWEQRLCIAMETDLDKVDVFRHNLFPERHSIKSLEFLAIFCFYVSFHLQGKKIKISLTILTANWPIIRYWRGYRNRNSTKSVIIDVNSIGKARGRSNNNFDHFADTIDFTSISHNFLVHNKTVDDYDYFDIKLISTRFT